MTEAKAWWESYFHQATWKLPIRLGNLQVALGYCKLS